ncbi:glucose 1-dehydrogenase [Desulfobacterota bacterium AH_259_B03_O07]|nr:glucose 1-dehydrogenase [Desulfobacterota bacterium AH_259_B03_O07]
MKAICVTPGVADSAHLKEVEKPSINDVPDGRGVLVKILRVGVDGTDREINAAEYGAAPDGYDYLIIGHESFGIVEEVGPKVTELQVGDYVAATVRRPGNSFYDQIGTYDMTTDDVYFERGINLRHGYLTEYYVDSPEYIIEVPSRCRNIGVLMEPTSIAEKGIVQAYEIQRRMKIWRPKKAAVMGTGTLGLLASLFLVLRGLQVTSFGRKVPPYKNAELVEELGAKYISTKETSISEAAKEHGPFDIISEGTGNSGVVFEAAENLGKNGVLILTSITGGGRNLEIPADKINLDFVLGNKLMFGSVNANREYFEIGAKDLAQAVSQFPGWLDKLLTHPVQGLDNYQQMMDLLTSAKDAIKIFVEVAEE